MLFCLPPSAQDYIIKKYMKIDLEGNKQNMKIIEVVVVFFLFKKFLHCYLFIMKLICYSMFVV